MPRALVSIIAIIVAAAVSSGCAVLEPLACMTERASDSLALRARQMRVAQTRARHVWEERREQARQDDDGGGLAACCAEAGSIQETMETEIRLLVDNGITVDGMSLDFDRLKELAKLQEEYDEEYEEAREAWESVERERRRRHDAAQRAMEQARAEARSQRAMGDCINVPPDCAFPPPSEYAMAPPPQRRAVGLEEIPIVLRANARLNVQGLTYGQSRVRREYLPAEQAKQPCAMPCDACCPSPVGVGSGYSFPEPTQAPASDAETGEDVARQAPSTGEPSDSRPISGDSPTPPVTSRTATAPDYQVGSVKLGNLFR